ncbi:unnamed protein product [Scytosiphon promiscuus]
MADHTHVPTVDTSKEEAALACSRLPVLAYFREGSGRTTVGFFVAALNLLALAYLAWFFSSSCTTQHGVLPSESPSSDVTDPDSYVPPALAELEDQAGVTMLERSLIYYSATDTFERGGTVDGVDTTLSYWEPQSFTCGCGAGGDCNLASCGGTIPIVVKYEQCPPFEEAFALATGLVVWLNVGITVLCVLALCCCSANIRGRDSSTGSAIKLRKWDFVKIFSLQWDSAG